MVVMFHFFMEYVKSVARNISSRSGESSNALPSEGIETVMLVAELNSLYVYAQMSNGLWKQLGEVTNDLPAVAWNSNGEVARGIEECSAVYA